MLTTINRIQARSLLVGVTLAVLCASVQAPYASEAILAIHCRSSNSFGQPGTKIRDDSSLFRFKAVRSSSPFVQDFVVSAISRFAV